MRMSISNGLASVRLTPRPRPIAWTSCASQIAQRTSSALGSGVIRAFNPDATPRAHSDASRRPPVSDGAVVIDGDFLHLGPEQCPGCSFYRAGCRLGPADNDDQSNVFPSILTGDVVEVSHGDVRRKAAGH